MLRMTILGGLPVAVPDIFLGAGAPSSAIDRSHSLRSLDSATGGASFAPHHARMWVNRFAILARRGGKVNAGF